METKILLGMFLLSGFVTIKGQLVIPGGNAPVSIYPDNSEQYRDVVDFLTKYLEDNKLTRDSCNTTVSVGITDSKKQVVAGMRYNLEIVVTYLFDCLDGQDQEPVDVKYCSVSIWVKLDNTIEFVPGKEPNQDNCSDTPTD